jgi:hypothetical protein
MYDFWFALGQGIIDPNGCIQAVDNGHPNFTFLPRISIVFKPDGAALLQGPSTGTLEEKPVRGVRQSIFAYLKNIYKDNAPPIGLYTAGRMCQLYMIPQFRRGDVTSTFQGILNYANGGYQHMVTAFGASSLPKFPALLGLCLMDEQFADAITGYPGGDQTRQAEMLEILTEFGISSPSGPDWNRIKAFVGTQGFADAESRFMGKDEEDPWAKTGSTFEQMIFWAGKSDYAIP